MNGSDGSDSSVPTWASRLARGLGYVIGGIIGIALMMIVLIICFWVVRGVGSALLGWDLFA